MSLRSSCSDAEASHEVWGPSSSSISGFLSTFSHHPTQHQCSHSRCAFCYWDSADIHFTVYSSTHLLPRVKTATMPRTAVSSMPRAVARGLRLSSTAAPSPATTTLRSVAPSSRSHIRMTNPVAIRRLLSTTSNTARGIMPDTDEPQRKEVDTTGTEVPKNVATLTENQYHELADTYLDFLVAKLEDLQEVREGLDVEYAVRLPCYAPRLAWAVLIGKPSLTSSVDRTGSSPWLSPTKGPMYSTNSRSIDKSGFPPPSPGRSVTTG